MFRKFLDYNLEIFCATIIVLTLVRILFFPNLSFIQNLVHAFALIAVLHEFEEKRVPGGFYEMTQRILGINQATTDKGLSSSFVMLYWVIVLGLSFIFDNCIMLFVMLIALGILELIGHTAIVFVGKLGKPYSPGMISAWLMGAMGIYSIVLLNTYGMATWVDYLGGTLLMIFGFVLMQRGTLSATDMTFKDFLGNLKKLFSGKRSSNNAD